jgi:hypothetical protein
MSALSPSWLASLTRMIPPGTPIQRGGLMQECNDAAFADYARPRELPDGTLGWPIRLPRGDDCFASALSTCLQIDIADVPDPRIDERLAAGESADDIERDMSSTLERWLTRRGLQMSVHRKVPVALPRWIGVVVIAGAFRSHCLCMHYGDVLFDPLVAASEDGRIDGRAVRQFGAKDVKIGLSFDVADTASKPGHKHKE